MEFYNTRASVRTSRIGPRIFLRQEKLGYAALAGGSASTA